MNEGETDEGWAAESSESAESTGRASSWSGDRNLPVDVMAPNANPGSKFGHGSVAAWSRRAAGGRTSCHGREGDGTLLAVCSTGGDGVHTPFTRGRIVGQGREGLRRPAQTPFPFPVWSPRRGGCWKQVEGPWGEGEGVRER